jgi:hypothetical protein
VSAWIVSKPHIDCLVQACVVEGLVPLDQATETGRMLWQENHNSIADRYADDDPVGSCNAKSVTHCPEVADYHFEGIEAPLDDAIVRWQINCFDYQSCEHEAWETSEARALVHKLADVLNARHPDDEDWYRKAPSVQGWHPWGLDNLAQAVAK